jgi:hypothetical protein
MFAIIMSIMMNLDILNNQPFCMRKNPRFIDMFYDDVYTICVLLPVYYICYKLHYDVLCILSLACIDFIFFHMGMLYGSRFNKEIHLNQIEELCDELSQRQIDQNASFSRSMTIDQENLVKEQLNRVVEETNLRNRKKLSTPSISEDYDDLPPLVPIYNVNGFKYSENHYLNAID